MEKEGTEIEIEIIETLVHILTETAMVVVTTETTEDFGTEVSGTEEEKGD